MRIEIISNWRREKLGCRVYVWDDEKVLEMASDRYTEL
jgi:hypothetical protein